jgi:hypothetical protein
MLCYVKKQSVRECLERSRISPSLTVQVNFECECECECDYDCDSIDDHSNMDECAVNNHD